MNALKVCCRWDHLKATGGIALLVGTWLTFFNQADVIAAHGLDKTLLLKIARMEALEREEATLHETGEAARSAVSRRRIPFADRDP